MPAAEILSNCPTLLAITLPETRSSTFGMFKGVSVQLKLIKRGRNSYRKKLCLPCRRCVPASGWSWTFFELIGWSKIWIYWFEDWFNSLVLRSRSTHSPSAQLRPWMNCKTYKCWGWLYWAASDCFIYIWKHKFSYEFRWIYTRNLSFEFIKTKS